VAVGALHTEGFESQGRGRWVAAGAIGHIMGPKEGEPSLPVDVRHIAYDPGVGSMAPAAVIANCLLVQVCMALVALRIRFFKHQGDMTLPAFDLGMLSLKGHGGCVMVVGVNLGIQFPAFGAVALVARDLEIVSVRGIGLPCGKNEHGQEGGQYQ